MLRVWNISLVIIAFVLTLFRVALLPESRFAFLASKAPGAEIGAAPGATTTVPAAPGLAVPAQGHVGGGARLRTTVDPGRPARAVAGSPALPANR